MPTVKTVFEGLSHDFFWHPLRHAPRVRVAFARPTTGFLDMQALWPAAQPTYTSRYTHHSTKRFSFAARFGVCVCVCVKPHHLEPRHDPSFDRKLDHMSASPVFVCIFMLCLRGPQPSSPWRCSLPPGRWHRRIPGIAGRTRADKAWNEDGFGRSCFGLLDEK